MFSTMRGNTQGNEEDEAKEDAKKAMDTVPNPPSFFYNDMEKWNKKFAKHIKEREYFKRQIQKTGEISCLTKNTNIRAAETKSADAKDNHPSLFG